MANWMLLPPVSTPIARMMRIAWLRRFWYSLSVRVWAGATVIESPVCTPIGSRFSIEHTMTTLSFLSRTTSSSNSFQPRRLSSIRHEWVGDKKSARESFSVNSASVFTNPPPSPPRVNEGRSTAGRPISWMIFLPSSSEVATKDRALCTPIESMVRLKVSRSSARWMTSGLAPKISTL